MGKINIESKAKLHNDFYFVLTDGKTGQIKQKAWAYNIILNRGFSHILNNFEGSTYSNRRYCLMRDPNHDATTTGAIQRLGGKIAIGTGTGIISPTRTNLFTYLGYKNAEYHGRSYNYASRMASYTAKASWTELEHQNTLITEVGLSSYFPTSSYLTTHALIEDSEGNPISINKGEFDVLTVYATVYIIVDDSIGGDNFSLVEGANALQRNFLLDMVYRNMSVYQPKFVVGKSSDAIQPTDEPVKTTVLVGAILAANQKIKDVANKRITFQYRFASNEANDPQGIWEIGFYIGEYAYDGHYTAEFSSNWNVYRSVFRSVMPVSGVWQGKDITNEEIGTGTGEQTIFNFQWKPIVENSEVVRVNGIVQTKTTHYSIDYSTGVIQFVNAPALGESITVDYSVVFIPKDVNHVLDVSFAFQFADGNN